MCVCVSPQVALLRQEVGSQFPVTCAQVVRTMNCFVAGPHRVEVAVMFFACLTDRKNFWLILYK